MNQIKGNYHQTPKLFTPLDLLERTVFSEIEYPNEKRE